MNEGEQFTILATPLKNLFPTNLWNALGRDQIDGVFIVILLLPQLHHAFTELTITQPGVRHDIPAQGFRNQIGGDLPMSQLASGKSHSGFSPAIGL